MPDRPRNPYRLIRDEKAAALQKQTEQELAGIADPNPIDLVFSRAELSSATFKIDLHRMRKAEALDALEEGLNRAIINNEDIIQIIHGKGTGAMQDIVTKWLNEKKDQGLISEFRPGVQPIDAGAVMYALLAD